MALTGRDTRGDLQLYSHPSLQPLILHDVTRTRKTIGFGSYGRVEEVAIPGAFGAAKKIHDFLTKQDPNWLAKEVADDYIQKFLSECTMMSRLRHPHIVQFLGLWFEADSSLYLVMEKMMTSLHDVLEPADRQSPSTAKPGIPLGLKCSILQDIARGLAFLHKQSPPVIHRDLSARNVLLNSAMTAKIADLGMARIMPPRDKLPMTKAPGALVYMPPEALDDSSSYNTSIDIFSLGVIVMFVLVEEFPMSLKAHSYTDEVKGLVARTELQRRENYVTKAYRELPKTHPLIWLMESCLENLPKNRPSIDRALQMLDQAMIEVKGQAQLDKLQLLKMLEEREVAARKQHELNLNLTGELEDYRHQTKSLMADLRAKEDEIVSLREKISSNEQTQQQKCDAWREEVEKLSPLKDQLARANQNNSQLQQDLVRLSHDNSRLQQELARVSEPSLAKQLPDIDSGSNDQGRDVLERRVSDYDQQAMQLALEEARAHNFNQDSTAAWQERLASLAAQLEEASKRMFRYREERNTARLMLKSLQEQIDVFQTNVQQLQLSPTIKKSFGPGSPAQPVDVTMKDGVTRSLIIERPRNKLNPKVKPEVIVKRKGGHFETGVLAFVGVLDGKEMAGVILDLPTGNNDGAFKDGKYYFKCTAGHGIFCSLINIFVEATSPSV